MLEPRDLPKPPGHFLTYWVIFDHPKDFPDHFVLRAQFSCYREAEGLEDHGVITQDDGGRLVVVASRLAWTGHTVDMLRAWLIGWCTNIGRQPGDDPNIVEVWLE